MNLKLRRAFRNSTNEIRRAIVEADLGGDDERVRDLRQQLRRREELRTRLGWE